MRWVDKVIDIALRNKELIEDDAGNLMGNLHFSIERIEDYGF